MLKAKDLRCGNCIYWLLPEGTEKQIIVISAIGAVSNTIAYGHGDVANLNVCEPIPLTHEILKQCGFEHNEGSDYVIAIGDNTLSIYEDGSTSILDESKERMNMVCLPNKFEYLHQLQNLYMDLSGEELGFNYEQLSTL